MFNDNDYNAKSLALLRYALSKKGVSKDSYYIGVEGDERSHDDKLCLLKSQGEHWLLLYVERGKVSQKVIHTSLREAIINFYWKLTQRDSPWDYRLEWEQETGDSF